MEESPVDDNNQEGLSNPMNFIFYLSCYLVPQQDNVVLLPSDDVTKFLLSMRTMCKAVNELIVPLLLKHCMYIGSKEKAIQLATELERLEKQPPSWSIGFLSLFSEFMVTENLVLSFCPFPPLSPLDSVSEYEKTAYAVRTILVTVGSMLRTLVLNVRFPLFHPDYRNNNFETILRGGFETLVNLEEFSSIQHESFINHFYQNGYIWTLWPNLRCLQLMNPQPLAGGKSNLWLNFARMPCLETVVLVHPGRTSMHNVNVKIRWLNAVNKAARETRGTPYAPRSADVTFILANFAPIQPCYSLFRRNWETRDPHGNVRVLKRKVPCGKCRKCWKMPDDAWSIVQKRVLKWACEGALWDEDVRGVKDAMCRRTKRKAEYTSNAKCLYSGTKH